jgi:hypothetical protein
LLITFVYHLCLDGGFTVKGFAGRVLKCVGGAPATGDERDEESWWAMFVNLFTTQTRAPPSGADPSSLVGSKIKEEEDVLHVLTLPSFDNKLSKRHCELLVSYLTAPYLRIPLLLSFFAQQDRVGALANPKLQAVLDCALFEPGYWLPKDATQETMQIPFRNRRKNLATPCGLLFNELQHSPAGLLKSLADMLDVILDLETNQYAAATSEVILYLVRLLVRVHFCMCECVLV